MNLIVKIIVILALFGSAISLTLSNKVDIEYCGACGYGGPANRLKKAIISALGVDVDAHSANSKTGIIKVSWVKGGNLMTVWNKGREPTEAGHSLIIDLLKQSQ